MSIFEAQIFWPLVAFLVAGSIGFLSVAWLVYVSLKAHGSVQSTEPEREVVFVPVQGSGMHPHKPPTTH